MRALSRAAIAAVAGAAILSTASCGAGAPGNGDKDEEGSASGLAQVDPCTMVPTDVLASFGLRGPGDPDSNGASEPGCYFAGDPISGTFYKNQEMTVATYGDKPGIWERYDRKQVDGRAAASGVATGAGDTGVCTTLFDAGGGVIILTVSNKGEASIDSCAEGLKIAEKIAPGLPK
ncbi:DUF3558 family protein [Saccharopolyspora sp. WRP15-2]|uniref:DUF3558 family protein n=1 Tax=Saccharopolyspora oryzae TaxID=2997343 RepID=A0ABT4V612_9PSEU|nr:DUF3558 family protein [Saccharopolyspora oryzae]MDA3629268.1 DUF3558 family protein [Saccharopolyspora oryzae]